MYDRVRLLHDVIDEARIADVAMDKGIIRPTLQVPEISGIPGVGQLIKVNDAVALVFRKVMPDEVAADEPTAACH
jgi:hypothetical protein